MEKDPSPLAIRLRPHEKGVPELGRSIKGNSWYIPKASSGNAHFEIWISSPFMKRINYELTNLLSIKYTLRGHNGWNHSHLKNQAQSTFGTMLLKGQDGPKPWYQKVSLYTIFIQRDNKENLERCSMECVRLFA